MFAKSLLLLAAAAVSAELPLMPYPQQVEVKDGQFTIDNNFSVHMTGASSPRLLAAREGLCKKLSQQTGLYLHRCLQGDASSPLQIQADEMAPQAGDIRARKEGYSLDVSGEKITLSAPQDLGALHGMQTLSQLAHNGVSIPSVVIEDEPRFVWRGVLLDCARHFLSIDTVKRQLNALAAAKLNVFHWHLTDDQGWRIESLAYPKLQEVSSDGNYYTRDQIKEVVALADTLGIRVIPEFDVPGHASTIAHAYPDLASGDGPYPMERGWGVFKPTLDPSKDEVYTFVNTIIDELVELFPDEYIHIGGDEVNTYEWDNNPVIQQYMADRDLADGHALAAYFNQKTNAKMASVGRKMIGWDETYHPSLPKDVVIQSWRGHDSLAQTAVSGHEALLSTGFYIDQPQPTSFHYRNEIVPRGLAGDITVGAGEKLEVFDIVMPRLSGSSSAKGHAILIQNANNEWRGFMAFKGKSLVDARKLAYDGTHLSFEVDCWMGPYAPELTIQGDSLSGPILIGGNTPYPATGTRVTGDEAKAVVDGVKLPTTLTESQVADKLLGGEITMWAELVLESTLDTRMWPRSFALSERFWSAKSQTDEEDMYNRLQKMDEWVQRTDLLKYSQLQQEGLRRLFPGQDIAAYLTLSEVIEQAQYYTRHHVQRGNDEYHQLKAQNNFVDTLPAESLVLVFFNRAVKAYLKGDQNEKSHLQHKLSKWAAAAESVTVSTGDAEISTLAAQVIRLCGMAKCSLAGDQDCGNKAQALIEVEAMRLLQGEVVVGLASAVKPLLMESFGLEDKFTRHSNTVVKFEQKDLFQSPTSKAGCLSRCLQTPQCSGVDYGYGTCHGKANAMGEGETVNSANFFHFERKA